MISTFLLQLGAGCLFGALPVPAKASGRAFNRFVALLAATILALGAAVAFRHPPAAAPTRPLWAIAVGAAMASALASHRGRLGSGRIVLQGAAAFAGAGLVVDALALAAARGASPAAAAHHVLDAVSASWLLGAVLVAMILGHYYLNIAGLAIEHLVRLCAIAVAAVGLRGGSFAWGMAAGGAEILAPFAGGAPGAPDLLPAVVLLQRLLFGLAGAAALTIMAWRTARIASTQSATGILYIGVVAVLVGELASRYLLFSTGGPL